MKITSLIFLFNAPQSSMPLISFQSKATNVISQQSLFSYSTKTDKNFQSINNQYIPYYQSLRLFPAAIKFAWQIRAINQFGNPGTANDGKSESNCFVYNKVHRQMLALTVEANGCEINSGPIAVTGVTVSYKYSAKEEDTKVYTDTDKYSNSVKVDSIKLQK
jgi:hypothetical protein